MPNTKIRIGVDIDGCIFDQLSAIIAYSALNYNLLIKDSQVTQFSLTETTPLTRLQLSTMFSDPQYHALLHPLPDVQLTLNTLSKWGFWIELVSARFDAIYDITVNSLQQYSIPYNMMFLGIQDKSSHALHHNLTYFVEDRWKNAENLSQSLTGVFLIDHHWNSVGVNRQTLPKGMIRVGDNGQNSWLEILDYFMKLRKNPRSK